MAIKISTAPCCWGVDDVNNPFLPPWQHVLHEASQAGYRGIELGPYGYLPLDVHTVGDVLTAHDLHVVAGTIFDNLVDPRNLSNLLEQTHLFAPYLRTYPLSSRSPANVSVCPIWL